MNEEDYSCIIRDLPWNSVFKKCKYCGNDFRIFTRKFAVKNSILNHHKKKKPEYCSRICVAKYNREKN